MIKRCDCPGQLELGLEWSYLERFESNNEGEEIYEKVTSSFYERKKSKVAPNPVLAEIIKNACNLVN